ncbi:MAG: hypothetical protein ACTHLN_04410 [Tepidisphaeraceae bacterium]
MSSSDAQKSELHESTADASTSPTAPGDERTTIADTPHAHAPWPTDRVVAPRVSGVRIIQDDTDEGGPLVVESDDPALNPPRVPSEPFPTDRTPEIDPPVSPK